MRTRIEARRFRNNFFLWDDDGMLCAADISTFPLRLIRRATTSRVAVAAAAAAAVVVVKGISVQETTILPVVKGLKKES
jgi:hypothetical protein